MDASSLPSSRPTSARGVPLSLAERVALYCHQSTAANNAGVLRNVPKPTADEIAEFLRQSDANGATLYEDAALVRLLLTDSDYDAVCREVLSLQDAIAWHAQHPSQRKQASTSSLHLLLLSAHVFSGDEIRAAHELAASCGLEEELTLFPKDVSDSASAHRDEEPILLGEETQQPPSNQSVAAVITDIEPQKTELPERVDMDDDEARVDDISFVHEDTTTSDRSEHEGNQTSALPLPNSRLQAAVVDFVPQPATSTRDSDDECGRDMEPAQSELTHVLPQSDIADGPDSLPPKPALHEDRDIGVPSFDIGDDSLMVPVTTSVVDNVVLSEDAWKRERIKAVAESAVHEVINASLEHILSFLRARHSDFQDPTADEMVPVRDDSPTAFIDSELPPTSDDHIESMVRTLDADLRDDEDEDKEDAAIGGDAALLGQLQSASLESEEHTVLAVADVSTVPVLGNQEASLIVGGKHDACERPSVLFQIGDAIEARYRGRKHYFPGIITDVHAGEGTYDVSYKDGDSETHVHGALIRFTAASARDLRLTTTDSDRASSDRVKGVVGESFRVGDAVQARYRNLPQYFLGEIAAVRGGDKYDVRFGDGEYESDVSAESIRPVIPTREERVLGSAGAVAVVTSADRIGEGAAMEVQTGSEAHQIATDSSSTHDGSRVKDESGSCTSEHAADKDQRHEANESTPSSASTTCVQPPRMARSLTEGAHTVKPVETTNFYRVDEFKDGKNSQKSSKRVVNELDVTRKPSSWSGSEIRKSTSRNRGLDATPTGVATESRIRETTAAAAEATPVVPFDSKTKQTKRSRPPSKDTREESPTIASARALLDDHGDSDDDDNPPPNVPIDLSDDDEALAVDRILHATAQIASAAPSADPKTARSNPPAHAQIVELKKKKGLSKKPQPASHDRNEPAPTVPVLSPSTLRYLSPQPKAPVTARTQRPKTSSHSTSTPRAGTATNQKGRRVPSEAEKEPVISWKELEEWKNVDLILNRKRRIVHHGQVEGSDVPWGEEFAAIQSLKRFAIQYPEVLRDHIESKLAEVVNSDSSTGTTRPMTTNATSVARDALFLVKDLAFLLRHRLVPFIDSILPVVLPAVFHSQKRFLCDTAYEVLEALVTHCNSRRLVVALLKQALQFPRDDLRLVNLTCLYVEKCLTTLSAAAAQELMVRSATTSLDAIAELLSCKSAACQSSLQKSLLMLQLAVGEEEMERLLADHLVGNALALVRRHVALAGTAARGTSRSPSTSPKKLAHQQQQQPQHLSGTPAKQAAALAAAAANAGGGVSILQRMLTQRQNRIVPAPE